MGHFWRPVAMALKLLENSHGNTLTVELNRRDHVGGKKLVRNILQRIETGLGIPVFPRDRILSAISEDGLRWKRVPGIAVDTGGEPFSEMVYWPHLVDFTPQNRLYFMGSHQQDGQWRERILSAVRSGSGNWSVDAVERLQPGGEFDRHKVFAPWLVDSGENLRMYYAGKDEHGFSRILSAVSTDGLHWEKEPGVRIDPSLFSVASVYGPSVVRDSDRWVMMVSASTGRKSALALAVSDNGLDWATGEADEETFNPGPCHCAENPSLLRLGSGYRVYYSGYERGIYGSRIYCSETSDWHSWTRPVLCLGHEGRFERHGVNFCHVVREQGGGFLMYYTGFWGRHLLSPYTVLKHVIKARQAAMD